MNITSYIQVFNTIPEEVSNEVVEYIKNNDFKKNLK